MSAIFDTSHQFFHCSQFIINMNMVHNLLPRYHMLQVTKREKKLTVIETKKPQNKNNEFADD